MLYTGFDVKGFLFSSNFLIEADLGLCFQSGQAEAETFVNML